MEAVREPKIKQKKKKILNQENKQLTPKSAEDVLILKPDISSSVHPLDQHVEIKNHTLKSELKQYSGNNINFTSDIPEQKVDEEVKQVAKVPTAPLLVNGDACHVELNANFQSTIHCDEILNESKSEKDVSTINYAHDQIDVSTISDLLKNLSSEKVIPVDTKLYPSLEKSNEDILVYESLIKADIGASMHKASALANKSFTLFMQDIGETENHDFYDLVQLFKNARHNLSADQNKIKNLKCILKTHEGKFWVQVQKQIDKHGQCQNGHRISLNHKYFVNELNTTIFTDVKQVLQELEDLISSSLIPHSYEVHRAKLKIDYFLCDLKKKIKHSFVNVGLSSGLDSDVYMHYGNLIKELKICINILFLHQRLPTRDEEFITLTRDWLTDLVIELLQIKHPDHNLFVLNHILRCPSGIHSWASQLVQLPTLPLYSTKDDLFKLFDCDEMNYCLTSILLILNPVPEKEKFLKYLKTTPSFEVASENFVVLDSSGEEVESKCDFFKEWSEDDIISLLNQIPMYNIFKHSFEISVKDEYDPSRITETNIQKVLALYILLEDLFLSGLVTYNCELHLCVAKTIGNFIVSIVHCVSSHWEAFKKLNANNYGLQREFDRFLFHTLKILYSAEKYNMLEFLPELKFNNVSPKVLWNMLWIFHRSINEAEENIYKAKDVEINLKVKSNRILLNNTLINCTYDNATKILQTMTNMALSTLAEKDFICCIVQEIFEITLSRINNAIFLLRDLADSYPFVVSYLLELLNDADDNAVKDFVNVFSKTILLKWVPKMEEIETLSQWLLSHPLSAAKNQLSRNILRNMNWSIQEGEFVLPVELHKQIGLLIIEAYSKYDVDGNNWSASKGINQMIQIYASIRYLGTGKDNGFISWAWETLFALKLHVMNHLKPSWIKIFDGAYDVHDFPDVNLDPQLSNLLNLYEQKQPAACYLVLAMTKVGHSLEYLSKEGLDIVSMLIQQKQYAASIQCLYLIVPFFVKNSELIIRNRTFMQAFLQLLLADQKQLKLTNEVVVGSVFSKIVEMIKLQIFQAWKVTVECANPLIKLWIQLLTEFLIAEDYIALMSSSGPNLISCLLDNLVKMSFIHMHTRTGVLDQMFMICDPRFTLSEGRKQSMWNKLFSTTRHVSLLLPKSSADNIWFAWCVIVSETNQKMIQDIWLATVNELALDSLLLPDAAFKMAMKPFPKSLLHIDYLPVYRYCLQIISTPANHPVLPLLCQNFFLNYFQRGTLTGVQGKSVGNRFFKAPTESKMLQLLEKKLKDAEEFYKNYLKNLKSVKLQNQVADFPNKVNFFKNLIITFTAFRVWLKDLNLQGSNICFPALEPKYLSDKLKLILENDQRLWIDLVDVQKHKEELMPQNDLWAYQVNTTTFATTVSKTEKDDDGKLIWKTLNSQQTVTPLPPLKEKQFPVKEINKTVLSCWSSLCEEINQDHVIIYRETENFGMKLSEMHVLNKKFFNLIPLEYKVVDHEQYFEKTCSCSVLVKFKLKFQKTIANEKVKKNIDMNRIDFEQELLEIKKYPTQQLCVAGIHIENYVQALVEEMEKSNLKTAKNLEEVALNLFYEQLTKIDKIVSATNHFLPSKHLFSLCIDMLGKKIVVGREDQCLPLSKLIVANSSGAGLASPFFSLKNASIETLLAVYDVLINSMTTQSYPALFTLLSKIKLREFLNENKVSFLRRQELLKKISIALSYCGSDPDDNVLPVYESFKKHFSCILMFEFPQHFGEVVHILVNGTESRTLCVDLWYEFFQKLGCPINFKNITYEEVKNGLEKFSANYLLSPDQIQFVSCPLLQLSQILESLQFFQNHFTKMRKSCSSPVYLKYKNYVRAISIFLGIMGHSLLAILAKKEGNKMHTGQFWTLLHGAFQPWIDPVVVDNKMEFPWSLDDESIAKLMFQIFVLCIESFRKLVPTDLIHERDILSYVWHYYVKTYVEPGVRNYNVVICHSVLFNLPWNKFFPMFKDIESMLYVLQCKLPECRDILSKITVQISWADVINTIQVTQPPSIVQQTLGVLAKLIIQARLESEILKYDSLVKLIRSVEKLSWHLIDADTVQCLLEMYSAHCDPIHLIDSHKTFEKSYDEYTLEFIKVICCMIPVSDMPDNSQINASEVETKRLLYLQKYIELMQSCEAKCTSNTKYYKYFISILPNLFDEIEMLVIKDFNVNEHLTNALPLLHNIIVMLNFLENTEIQQNTLQSVLTWISSHPRSPLILPCIKSACAVLTKKSISVAIVENCITTRFNTELEDFGDVQDIWNIISLCINFSSDNQDEFLESCIKQNAYLILYEYVLRKQTSTVTPESKVYLLRSMVNWSGKFTGTECSEPKVFLLWDKILEVALCVAEDKNLMDAEHELLKFCSFLTLLSEDRTQEGFLSVFGLGKPSPFSVNFRFLCRALAAYVLSQMPKCGILRLEAGAVGHVGTSYKSICSHKYQVGMSSEPQPSSETLKAVECLISLKINRSYSALNNQVDHCLKYIYDPKFCFVETRHLLKDLALQTFPNVAYLHILENSSKF